MCGDWMGVGKRECARLRRGEGLQVAGAWEAAQQAVRGCSTLAVAIVRRGSSACGPAPRPPDSIGQVLRPLQTEIPGPGQFSVVQHLRNTSFQQNERNPESSIQPPASSISMRREAGQASQGPALEPSPSRHNAPFPYPVGLAWLPDRNPAAARMQRRERRCSDGALKDASSSPLSLANSQRVPVPRIPGFRA